MDSIGLLKLFIIRLCDASSSYYKDNIVIIMLEFAQESNVPTEKKQ